MTISPCPSARYVFATPAVMQTLLVYKKHVHCHGSTQISAYMDIKCPTDFYLFNINDTTEYVGHLRPNASIFSGMFNTKTSSFSPSTVFKCFV